VRHIRIPELVFFCGKLFATFDRFQTHILANDIGNRIANDIGNSMNKTCTICNKVFNYDCQLHKHKEKHNNQCPFCCKSFSSQGNLSNHISVMTGQGNLKCPVCDEIKEHKCELIKHVNKIHGNSKTCTFCGNKISIFNPLMHKCIICENIFECQCLVMKHLYDSHEVSDTCKFCGEKFKNVKQLLAHTQLIGKSLDINKCEICCEVFKHKCQLMKHTATVHNS